MNLASAFIDLLAKLLHLTASLLFLVIKHRKMFVMGAFLLPFNTVLLHLSSKISLFGAYPLVPLGIAPCAAFETLRGERLLE